MHRPIIAALAALALAASLPGCSGFRDAIGIGGKKQGPDEFMVTSRRQPLALPPDYSLRPPEPGAPARQDALAADEAKRAVFGAPNARAAADPSRPGFDRLSEGETSLLRQAGALGVDPNIRYTVDRETVALAEGNKTLVDQILFWREPARPEKLVDASAEAERLRQNAEAGKPATEGETPTIKRKRRGILDGLIN
jgi:hypothetical protein